jgi:hypothetical protein
MAGTGVVPWERDDISPYFSKKLGQPIRLPKSLHQRENQSNLSLPPASPEGGEQTGTQQHHGGGLRNRDIPDIGASR